MAFGIEKTGLDSIKEVNSAVLPHAAELANGIIQNAAVLLTGAITALDGERQLAVQQLKDDVLGPLLEESKAWRELLAKGFEGKINGNIPFEIKAKS